MIAREHVTTTNLGFRHVAPMTMYLPLEYITAIRTRFQVVPYGNDIFETVFRYLLSIVEACKKHGHLQPTGLSQQLRLRAEEL